MLERIKTFFFNSIFFVKLFNMLQNKLFTIFGLLYSKANLSKNTKKIQLQDQE